MKMMLRGEKKVKKTSLKGGLETKEYRFEWRLKSLVFGGD